MFYFNIKIFIKASFPSLIFIVHVSLSLFYFLINPKLVIINIGLASGNNTELVACAKTYSCIHL